MKLFRKIAAALSLSATLITTCQAIAAPADLNNQNYNRIEQQVVQSQQQTAAQIQQVQITLQKEINSLNSQLQAQIKQVQSNLQPQIQSLQQQINKLGEKQAASKAPR